jgi:DNA helicase II / ATP-dependent DNA helicase PcrA
VPGRELIPARTDIPDAPVVVHAVADEREEAEAIAAEIEQLLGGASFHALDSRAVDGRNRAEHELSFADFAVLYRTSAQAATVGEALARRGFPFQQRAHSRLTEMPGVPEIVAALSFSRAGTLGSAARETVAELLSEAARRAVADSQSAAEADSEREPEASAGNSAHGAETRVAIRAAADVLGPLAAKCGADLDRFLDELALGAEVDTWDPRADRISLLTLHAAKGLEFPVVFIAGCDDGLLPLRSWRGAEVDYAEERRLLFVGMTRATTRLTLYTAAKRTLRGEVMECSPSPFLSSVESALLDRRGGEAQGRGRRKTRVQQTTLF